MATRSAGAPTTDPGVDGLAGVLAAREIVITCGSGGVGKTTVAAAAAAMAAAEMGGRVLVLTIDPARRLATALGLEELGNVEVQVPAEAWAASGVHPRGELWAAMLDTKASWDELVATHAPDDETRDAILENPLYQNITGRFVQSHDYIAMERLYEIHRSGRYDLVVVDTPPTRNAIDFLDAPERMADFFSSRLLRWLIAPARSRMLTAASRPFYTIADRILGSQFLEDIAEFFILFQTMYEGFVERANSVERLLGDPRTAFVVVTTLEPAPTREARYFIDELIARDLSLGGVVANKVLPESLLRSENQAMARCLAERRGEVAEHLAVQVPALGDPRQLSRMLGEVGESFANFAAVARRESELRTELSRRAGQVVAVPYLETDVSDLTGLLALGVDLWGERSL
ncbi:MAG: ArsA-related P-loop ATPase [Acidimicrobiales bacterium]|nr:ArsA-related P-loop ATPase [Acidimicrobiales bacterium]